MKERRRHPRLPSRVRVWVSSQSRTIFSRVHDMSLGGVGLRVPSGFARGDAVKLTIRSESDEIERSGVIAWVEARGFGVSFVSE